MDTVTDALTGERVVGAAAPFRYTLTQKAAGNPIDIVAPADDLIFNLGVMGIPKNAPHPNAAKLFHNFMYSKEVSQFLSKNFWPTLRSNVPWAEGRTLGKLKWYRNPSTNLAAEVAEGIREVEGNHALTAVAGPNPDLMHGAGAFTLGARLRQMHLSKVPAVSVVLAALVLLVLYPFGWVCSCIGPGFRWYLDRDIRRTALVAATEQACFCRISNAERQGSR